MQIKKQAKVWQNSELLLTHFFKISKNINKRFFKKFVFTYTGRIYKIFFKKKFIKMNFNRSHKLIFKYDLPKWYWRQIPFDKHITTWMELPYPHYNRIITKLIKIRPLNPYTWRGLQYSRAHWTKKPGKISEYV